MADARAETFAVEQARYQERLDALLHGRYPMVSRAHLQRLISQGAIRVNGRMVKPAHRPRPGERIDVQWPPPVSAEAKPESIPLLVLHEDADLLVINKPPGLVVHPAAGHAEHTLVNALLHHCAGELSGIGGVARPGIVHRIDKETSGCLVVAKTDTAHQALADQFARRQVQKTYHALVCGELPNQQGEIRASIARHPSHRKKMAVTAGAGREAWTSFRILERLRQATLVEAILHTGRTHQIRVHFQFLGHPLVGDKIYGKKANQVLAAQTGCAPERQMLHAYRIGFRHPRTGIELVFEAPWPADFQAACDALRLPV